MAVEAIDTIVKPKTVNPADDGRIHIHDVPDAATIKKTAAISAEALDFPILSNNEVKITEAPPIAEKVTEAAVPVLGGEINTDEKRLEALTTELNSTLASHPNFMIKIAELVREILQLTQQISERDRTRIEDMKTKYNNLSETSSESMRSKGNTNVYMTLAAFCVQFGALAFTNENDQRFVKSLADQFPQLGSFFTSRQDAAQSEAMNKINLINTEIQNITNNQSSQSGWKEQIIAAFNEAKQWLQKASSAN